MTPRRFLKCKNDKASGTLNGFGEDWFWYVPDDPDFLKSEKSCKKARQWFIILQFWNTCLILCGR